MQKHAAVVVSTLIELVQFCLPHRAPDTIEPLQLTAQPAPAPPLLTGTGMRTLY